MRIIGSGVRRGWSYRNVTAVLVALGLFLAACGDSSTGSTTSAVPISPSTTIGTTTSQAGTTAPPTTVPPTTAPPTTLPPTTLPPTTLPATTAPPTTVLSAAALCGQYGPMEQIGVVTASRITELSGLAASRIRDDVVWAHNDSGDRARIYALSLEGELLQTVALEGVDAVDWEDMAAGPGPEAGATYLYVADIGDNDENRSEVAVHRFIEPGPDTDSVADVTTIRLRYPDGPHDAEVLLLDAVADELLILTKTLSGNAFVYRAPAGASGAEPVIMTPAGSISLGLLRFATAGDVSFSGDRVAIRTYTDVFLWPRPAGSSVAQALAGPRCDGPETAEEQGEAVAFLGDDAYITIGEGTRQAVNLAPRG